MDLDPKILQEANRKLPGCDYIVDLYDMYFLWASDNALQETGYSREEIRKLRNFDVIISDRPISELRQEMFERVGRGNGTSEYDIRTKGKKVLHIKLRYQTFELDGGWYLAGQILDSSPKSTES